MAGATTPRFEAEAATARTGECLDTEFVSKLDDRARIDLGDLGIGELLALSRRILAELRRRGVIRSGNAPAGDYAELPVQRATSGELAPNSQKSWDVVARDGERLQVKARVVTDPRVLGERQPQRRASSSTSAATACSRRMRCWTPAPTGRSGFAQSSSDDTFAIRVYGRNSRSAKLGESQLARALDQFR
jgi:hypothetical protein